MRRARRRRVAFGATPVFPLAMEGVALWLRGDRQVIKRVSGSDVFVPEWRGLTGNVAAQATEANQPAFAAAGINGRPAVDFEVSSSHAITVPADASIDDLPLNGFYGLFVLQPESLVTTDYFLSKLGFSPFAGWRIAIGNDGAFEFLVNFNGGAGKWRTQTGLAVAGTPLIFEVSYDGGATTNDPVFRFNGALTTVNEPNTPIGSYGTDATYALDIGGTQGTADYDGMIGEIVLGNSILPDEEQAQLRAYAAAEWQIDVAA